MISFRSLMLVGCFALGAGSMVVLSPSADASGISSLRHLRLVKSFPMKDSVVTGSPDAIRLWLSEPTEAAISKITLASTTGTPIVLDALTRDTTKDAPLVAKLSKPAAPGSYMVSWKAMSKDGHVVNGTFGFRVTAAK